MGFVFRTFWIVWSPTGSSPPRCRHADEPSARAEATRLAKLNPGAEFFVLAAIGKAQKVDVAWSAASTEVPHDDDGIPF